MKLIKFLYTPMKYILLLGMIAAVIYFRSIIFQPNINQYINAGLSLAEDVLDVSIPSHPAKQGDEIKLVVHEECEFNEPIIAESVQIDKEAPASDEASKAEAVVAESEVVSDAVSPVDDVPSDDNADLVSGLTEAMNTIGEKVDALFESTTEQPAVENNQVDSPEVESLASAKAESGSEDIESADNEKDLVVSETDNNSPETKQVLMMARQSFWRGNMSDSENFYLNLIKMSDSEPDVYGELGNVYYSQGKWKQAGEAYYEAAVRLLALEQDEKNSKRVSYLLRVIQGLDMESAEKLKSKISG